MLGDVAGLSVLQELGVHGDTAGVRPVSTQDEEERPFPPAMSPLCPLLTKLTILPAGKERKFKASTQIRLHGVGLAEYLVERIWRLLVNSAEHRRSVRLSLPVSEGSGGDGERLGFLSCLPGVQCV